MQHIEAGLDGKNLGGCLVLLVLGNFAVALAKLGFLFRFFDFEDLFGLGTEAPSLFKDLSKIVLHVMLLDRALLRGVHADFDGASLHNESLLPVANLFPNILWEFFIQNFGPLGHISNERARTPGHLKVPFDGCPLILGVLSEVMHVKELEELEGVLLNHLRGRLEHLALLLLQSDYVQDKVLVEDPILIFDQLDPVGVHVLLDRVSDLDLCQRDDHVEGGIQLHLFRVYALHMRFFIREKRVEITSL
jgi:hypothetical protein